MKKVEYNSKMFVENMLFNKQKLYKYNKNL